jgi:hypothetical protein
MIGRTLFFFAVHAASVLTESQFSKGCFRPILQNFDAFSSEQEICWWQSFLQLFSITTYLYVQAWLQCKYTCFLGIPPRRICAAGACKMSGPEFLEKFFWTAGTSFCCEWGCSVDICLAMFECSPTMFGADVPFSMRYTRRVCLKKNPKMVSCWNNKKLYVTQKATVSVMISSCFIAEGAFGIRSNSKG